jgi:hypothetical protein
VSIWKRFQIGADTSKPCASNDRRVTAHLGNELARVVGRRPPTDQELLAICWLPWFRKGWMPLEMRTHLIDRLDQRFSGTVRLAIEQFLFAALNRDDAAGSSIPTFSFAMPSKDWRVKLSAWLALSREEGNDRDVIFLRYMNCAPLPVEFSRSFSNV